MAKPRERLAVSKQTTHSSCGEVQSKEIERGRG
jgi:hypothetical protein